MVSYSDLLFKLLPSVISSYLSARGLPEYSNQTVQNYKLFMRWIQDTPDVLRLDSVKSLFKALHIKGAKHESFERMKNSGYINQLYLAALVFRTGFPDDRRIWEYVNHLPETHRKLNIFVCNFFIPPSSSKSKGAEGSLFLTEPATIFEKILFLMATRTLHERKQTLPASFRFNFENMQRVGYAVQTYVRAWDAFAHAFHIEDAETMVYPYLLYREEEFEFRPIINTEQGFSPIRQMESLKGKFEPTVEDEECDEVARIRDIRADFVFRSLASEFFWKYRELILNRMLYNVEPKIAVAQLEGYCVDKDSNEVLAPICQELFKSMVEASGSNIFPRPASMSVPSSSVEQPVVTTGAEGKMVMRTREKKTVSDGTDDDSDGSDEDSDDLCLELKFPEDDVDQIESLHNENQRWNPPDGFLAFQNIPDIAIRYLACLWGTPSFLRTHQDRPISSWLATEKAGLAMACMDYFSATLCADMGVCISKSTIQNQDSGDGLFAMKDFKTGDVIGYYYGALVYEDIGDRSDMITRYGEEGVLGVRVTDFMKYGIELTLNSSGITMADSNVDHVFVVGCPFCPCSKINDYRYWDGDKQELTSDSGREGTRKPNVEMALSIPATPEKLYDHQTIEVRANQDIKEGEEFFLDYEIGYVTQ